MKKNYLFRCLLFLVTISIVSCDKDDILREAQLTNAVPFAIKTITKEELIRSNAASGSVFSEVTKLEKNSLQKSLDSLYGFKILTEFVKVIEKLDDSLTTYTFPTINFRDNKLKNIVVTEKNGAFATYIISYEYMTDGSTKIEKQLVSNDSSDYVKNWITIETTFCEWVSFQSPRDFSAGPPQWICTTTSETFFLGNTGGGGTSGGANNSGNQGNNFGNSGGNDLGSTWGSTPGGAGGSGGMNIITQPTFANHLSSLKAMSDDPGVKAEIKDWIENRLTTATSEIGTEWIVGGGLNGELAKRPAVLIGNQRDGAYFGDVVSNGTILRNHLHFNGLAPMFSGFDLFAHLGFFSQNRSGNFNTDSSQTTSMVVSSFGINPATNKAVSGVYAMRILNSDNAISDLNRLRTPDPSHPQYREIDFVHANMANNIIDLTEKQYRSNRSMGSTTALTETDYTSNQFISMYEGNFLLLLNHYQLDDSILIFKANLDSNNNITSWIKL